MATKPIINKLTPEQEAMIPAVRDEFLRRGGLVPGRKAQA